MIWGCWVLRRQGAARVCEAWKRTAEDFVDTVYEGRLREMMAMLDGARNCDREGIRTKGQRLELGHSYH